MVEILGMVAETYNRDVVMPRVYERVNQEIPAGKYLGPAATTQPSWPTWQFLR
jgi:hypothetical protein